MKNVISIIMGVFLLVSISYSQSQLEMNQNASSAYKASDKKLNEVYQKILKLYSKNDLFIKNLKTAQRIWLQYRDAQIEMKYPKRGEGYYGSILPMCKANYLEELTNIRVKQLEEWLNKPAEGDACGGTVGEFEVEDIK